MTGKKISGADFKAFYTDPQVWDVNGKPGWYVDDFLIQVDGMKDVSMDELHSKFGEQLESLPDDAAITIVSGYLEWQGSAEEPKGAETDLQLRFQEWDSARTEITFVATLKVSKNDSDSIARVQRTLDGLGAKIVRSDDRPVSAPSSPKP